MTALRFFFSITLDRYDLIKLLFREEQPRKLPTVLTQDEVTRLLDAAPGAKYKAALSGRAPDFGGAVADGLRSGSARMLLRVEQGKGPPRTATPCCHRCSLICCG